MKNTKLLFFIPLIFIFSINFTFAQKQKIKLQTFQFEVPYGMRSFPTDSSLLAKLMMDNHLFITVDDNMDKMLGLSKKNPNGVSKEIFKYSFDLKFSTIKDQYRGYDPTEKKTGKLKELNYTSQGFTCKASKTEEAYLEYRVMNIGGHYYEFIITGKKKFAKTHLSVIQEFWKGIKEN